MDQNPLDDKPLKRVRRHREMIEKMKEDQDKLKLSLFHESIESKRTSVKSSGSQEILRIQEQIELYTKKIEKEKNKIEDIDQKIAETNSHILEQRQQLGGVYASKENSNMIRRQVRVLENKLDKSLVKFNETIAKNRKLRERIDNNRRERVVFDSIYKKLERELHERKKEMTAIIQDSRIAYEERDKAESELNVLKLEAKKEKNEFENEYKKLVKLMEQDQRQRDEENQINNTNNTNNNSSYHMNSTYQNSMNTNSLNELSLNTNDHLLDENFSIDIYDENNSNNLNDKNNNQNIDEENNINNDETKNNNLMNYDELNELEEIYNNVLNTMKAKDMDDVITKFLEAENKNFSLFNFINDINSDIENYETLINNTKSKIESFKGQGMSSTTQRRRAIKEMETKLLTNQSKANEYEDRYQRSNRTTNQLKTGVHSIYTRIGCATSSVEELLGNEGVTESNILQYLGIIEQRVSEILQLYAASQIDTNDELDTTSYTSIKSPHIISITPPNWEDLSSGNESEEDDDERPLTRAELEKRTIKDLNKKDQFNKMKF